ncbi:MAG TPA: TrkA family potassium uptake protein [Dehalococcoidia bacterium]|nr:TrkA family potassium uptake protein [Dehalococcoidia bacterium]
MFVIIMGCGRLGAQLAVMLEDQGHEVTILDLDKYAFDHLPPGFKGRKFLGDGTDQDTLRRAGAERADAFISATRGDNRNALAAQVAKHVFHIKRVGSVIFDPIREEVYRELGLSTINPTRIEASLLMEAVMKAPVD